MTKADLRQQMIELLKGRQESKSSQSILDVVLVRALLSSAQKVLLYKALSSEPDIADVALFCDDVGLSWLYPPTSPEDPCLSGVDLVFVPGLAFTRDGARLGRGGGYFDRFLSRFEGTSVGVCFQEQVLDELPEEDHDQRVDHVIPLS